VLVIVLLISLESLAKSSFVKMVPMDCYVKTVVSQQALMEIVAVLVLKTILVLIVNFLHVQMEFLVQMVAVQILTQMVFVLAIALPDFLDQIVTLFILVLLVPMASHV